MDKNNNNSKLKILFSVITVIMTILICIFIMYALKVGVFESPEKLVKYIKGYGVMAPIIFIFIQIIQVVLPVIPGGASCLAGVLAFGGFAGFIYNYIGLCIGSVVAFLLSRKYGIKLVLKLFKEETVNKYVSYIKNKKFEKIFFWGIFLPGAPDDLLCYVAGVSNISFKKFLVIIILGKPLALYLYSLFINVFPSFLN